MYDSENTEKSTFTTFTTPYKVARYGRLGGRRYGMATNTWKDAERRVAELTGGIRMGVTGINTNDVVTDKLAIEIKHGKMPKFVTDALAQAKANRKGGRVPVACLHPHGAREFLCVLTLTDLLALMRSPEDVVQLQATIASTDTTIDKP